ncbi:MAG TPA: TIGR04282 family arsenosugar biosynthesis glycosyltransferase [Nitrospiraceae bacterium]|nr:TIGR04282 family arsenosugar biosynthesis glycosyltransferase [Nitrospiraceae bacterium]
MAMPGKGARQETSASRPSPRASRLQALEAALIIFAKAPIPGEVKTRLCPPLTPDEAASLHGSFVLDMLERSGKAATQGGGSKRAQGFDRFLACAPSSEHVFFKIMEERHGVRLIDQIGEDLGARMDQAFTTIFGLGYARVLLVGTDLPMLSELIFSQAFHRLVDHDLVLGPATDGGYFLIGLKQPAPQLFTGIPWSTDQVLAHTQRKADALGLKTALLAPERDIDTIEDLRVLIQECGLLPSASRPSPRSVALSKRTAGALRLLAERHKELMIG